MCYHGAGGGGFLDRRRRVRRIDPLLVSVRRLIVVVRLRLSWKTKRMNVFTKDPCNTRYYPFTPSDLDRGEIRATWRHVFAKDPCTILCYPVTPSQIWIAEKLRDRAPFDRYWAAQIEYVLMCRRGAFFARTSWNNRQRRRLPSCRRPGRAVGATHPRLPGAVDLSGAAIWQPSRPPPPRQRRLRRTRRRLHRRPPRRPLHPRPPQPPKVHPFLDTAFNSWLTCH